MAKGAYGQYMIRGQTVDTFLPGYERALVDSGFAVKEVAPQGSLIRHKAIWGSKGKAFLVGQIPFGKLLKAGKRLGAETEISQYGRDVLFRILVVPYMELFDKHEVFLISQGIFEKITDDEFSREKLNEILSRLASMGYRFG